MLLLKQLRFAATTKESNVPIIRSELAEFQPLLWSMNRLSINNDRLTSLVKDEMAANPQVRQINHIYMRI